MSNTDRVETQPADATLGSTNRKRPYAKGASRMEAPSLYGYGSPEAPIGIEPMMEVLQFYPGFCSPFVCLQPLARQSLN